MPIIDTKCPSFGFPFSGRSNQSTHNNLWHCLPWSQQWRLQPICDNVLDISSNKPHYVSTNHIIKTLTTNHTAKTKTDCTHKEQHCNAFSDTKLEMWLHFLIQPIHHWNLELIQPIEQNTMNNNIASIYIVGQHTKDPLVENIEKYKHSQFDQYIYCHWTEWNRRNRF